MPELPEVETYVRELEPELNGRDVIHAEVSWPRIIAEPTVETFESGMAGQTFATFGRRGKYMLLGLASGDTLIVHLRMTGKLLLQPGETPPQKHTHVQFDLNDGRRLFYNDPRKFGRLWLVNDPSHVLSRLGPEPLSESFSVDWLVAKMAGRTASIKALLLDQSVVAGVGNIYADEALFDAAIHPTRAGGQLNADELSALRTSVRMVLEAGIRYRGSSLGDSSELNYMRPGGSSGRFQDEFQVFRRTGQPCPNCGTEIERIVLAQRSTHFCPTCQPFDRS